MGRDIVGSPPWAVGSIGRSEEISPGGLHADNYLGRSMHLFIRTTCLGAKQSDQAGHHAISIR